MTTVTAVNISNMPRPVPGVKLSLKTRHPIATAVRGSKAPIQIFIQDFGIRCKSTKYKGEKIHNREQNRFYIVISSTSAVFLVYKETVSLSTNKLSIYETEIKMKNSMRKKLLVLGAFVSAVMLVSCTGSKKEAVTYTPEEIADAGQVMKYYDTSLALLKNMVKERDINAVLGYMEQQSKVQMFSHIMSPVISKKDSAVVMQPGDYFGDDVRQNLIQNYTELFQSRGQFYANFNKYLSLLKEKKTEGIADLLNDNYELSVEMSECKQNIFDILSPIVGQAQQVLLAENPVKEQIIAMKKMSLTMQSIINLYARKHVEDKARLDLKIMELRLQLDAAEKLPAVKGHEGQTEKFKDFLSKAEEFMKIVQDIRQKNSYTEEDFDEISSYGLSII